jgi:hypothetical protein
MSINWFDKIGNWNPQLLREIKGRFNLLNIGISSGISIFLQLLVIIYFYSQLPSVLAFITPINTVTSRYCIKKILEQNWYNHDCIVDAGGNFIINWQAWWLDIFVWLSIIGFFTLLLLGSWLLIQDIANEENRGTLNFIRLSPQSTSNILIGKLLGVPSLLYLGILLAIPFHLWAGQISGISLGLLLSFYGVIIASCLCFFTTALLFGLIAHSFNGFQAWLGSGSLFLFLFLGTVKWTRQNASDVINVLSPSLTLSSLISGFFSDYQFSWLGQDAKRLKWFDQQIGEANFQIALFSILVSVFCTYWIWQALLRRFANPGKTLLSKKQSYWFILGTEILLLGFSFKDTSNGIGESYGSLLSMNLFLFLGIMVALTPSRQSLYDWARYRHTKIPLNKQLWHGYWLHDLVWSESSPALLAIAINLVSSILILLPWAFQWQGAITSLILMVNWILIYAAIYQLILFLASQKQNFFSIAILGGLLVLPPIIFSIFSMTASSHSLFWLLAIFPAFWSWQAIEFISLQNISMIMVMHWLVLAGLSSYLMRELKKAGESTTNRTCLTDKNGRVIKEKLGGKQNLI